MDHVQPFSNPVISAVATRLKNGTALRGVFTAGRPSCSIGLPGAGTDDAVPPHQDAGHEQCGRGQSQDDPKHFDFPSCKVAKVEIVGPAENGVAQALRRRRTTSALTARVAALSVAATARLNAGLPAGLNGALAFATRPAAAISSSCVLTRAPAEPFGQILA